MAITAITAITATSTSLPPHCGPTRQELHHPELGHVRGRKGDSTPLDLKLMTLLKPRLGPRLWTLGVAYRKGKEDGSVHKS